MNTKKPAIHMNGIKSSQIAAIGHDPETNTLAIQFAPRKDGSPGSIYHYANFDAEKFAAFKSAKSICAAIIQHIEAVSVMKEAA